MVICQLPCQGSRPLKVKGDETRILLSRALIPPRPSDPSGNNAVINIAPGLLRRVGLRVAYLTPDALRHLLLSTMHDFLLWGPVHNYGDQ